MKCPAKYEIASDTHSDHCATMHCQREANHTGPHREMFWKGSCLIFWNDEGGALDGLTLEELIKLASGGESLEPEQTS